MPYLEIIQGLLIVVLGGGGYWLSRLAKDVKELEHNMNQCQSQMPKEYVLKDDYKTEISEIKKMLGNIYDILRESDKK